MKIAAIQTDIAWENPGENVRRIDRRLREAAALGARLAVLPEMCTCGFSMTAEAEPEGGPSETALLDIATGLDIHIVAGLPQLGPKGRENRAVLISPGEPARRFTKLHPFSFADEHLHYAPGRVEVTWNVEGLRISPLICYDLRFPESFRATADATDVYLVIANWPERRRAHWQTLLAARAIENQAFVVGVNRVGEGGGLRYTGDSVILSPWGEALACAAMADAVLIAEVNAADLAEARGTFPALRDRR